MNNFPGKYGSIHGSIRNRVTEPLLHETDRRLRAYALAASAAGVGLLALTQPADAQVVYTPANITITDGDLFLDLNCGPRVNFWLADNLESTNYGYAQEFVINGSADAGVIADKHGAAALLAESVIGSSRSFQTVHRAERLLAQAIETGYGGTWLSGNWANKQAYLGLKFNIQGQVHYGWAELTVRAAVHHNNLQVHATLLGYAYESTPNQSIRAGQTKDADTATPNTFSPQAGTLGALARGAASLGHCPDVEPHTARPHRPRK
jgi:hypothetical protein